MDERDAIHFSRDEIEKLAEFLVSLRLFGGHFRVLERGNGWLVYVE